MQPNNVDKHCYFHEKMNLTLLPHVMNFIRLLMKQLICSGNTCGESMMLWYKKILNAKYETDLCYHSIITQNHFIIAFMLIKICYEQGFYC